MYIIQSNYDVELNHKIIRVYIKNKVITKNCVFVAWNILWLQANICSFVMSILVIDLFFESCSG